VKHLLLQRLVALVPILVLVTFGTFMLISLVPGDPATTLAGGVDAKPADIAAIRTSLHLDEPLLEQYGRWLFHAVQFDFGDSLYGTEAVSETLSRRLPVTLSLVLATLVVALVVGIPLGLIGGVRQGGWADRSVRTFAGLGFAIPDFWLGTLLVVFVAVQHSWLPVSGFTQITDSPGEWLRYITLPALTLGYAMAALIARQLRAGMMDVLDTNYVRAAWARGTPRRTLFRHAMKNASIPVITTTATQFGLLLGGTVIVEQIFSIPGIGNLLFSSVIAGDLPVIQGIVVIFVLAQLALGLVMDLGYAWANPRVRVS
jgi:peptide/nickel transport system permease protein